MRGSSKQLSLLLARILVGLTFILVVMGGVVHSTASSLACPDWPLCYGEVMPEMKGGVAIEHSHRMVATLVGFLTLILAGVLRKKHPGLQKYGWWALGVVVVQGVLGGLTVLFQLPPFVSTAHLATSMFFFALMITIVFHLHRSTRVGMEKPLRDLSFRACGRLSCLLKGTLVLVFVQLVLGALVRHLGAGMACPDIPFCFGEIWPDGINTQMFLQILHRWNGMLCFFGMLLLLFFCDSAHGRLKRQAGFLVFVTALQVVLGVLSVTRFLQAHVVSSHLALGALLWGLFVRFSLDYFESVQQTDVA